MIKHKFISFLFFALLLLPVSIPINRQEAEVKDQISVDSRQLDKRAQILKDYFQRYNSPLQYHAQDFIDASDTYNLDWRLVPSIAGVESTFGKFIPGGHEPSSTTYNAWGWGVYGPQALGFSSWRNGIFTVSEGLRKNYVNKGLTEPYAMNKVYAASPTWGSKVSYFMKDLEYFSQTYEAKTSPETEKSLPKVAVISAQLTSQPSN